MGWIKRRWNPEEADEWTREDFFGIVLSVISYVSLAVGTPLVFFFWWGWLLLGVGVISLLLMIYVIDPKLKAISSEYEKRQKHYLEELNRKIRWED